MARVKAQLRRYKTMTPKEEKNMVTIGALTIDQDNHQCILNNQTLSLTPTEFSILWLLCKHKGKVVTVDQRNFGVKSIIQILAVLLWYIFVI